MYLYDVSVELFSFSSLSIILPNVISPTFHNAQVRYSTGIVLITFATVLLAFATVLITFVRKAKFKFDQNALGQACAIFVPCSGIVDY